MAELVKPQPADVDELGPKVLGALIQSKVTERFRDVPVIPYTKIEARQYLEYFVTLPQEFCGVDVRGLYGHKTGRQTLLRRYSRRNFNARYPFQPSHVGNREIETRVQLLTPLSEVDNWIFTLTFRNNGEQPVYSSRLSSSPDAEEHWLTNLAREATAEDLREFLGILHQEPTKQTLPSLGRSLSFR